MYIIFAKDRNLASAFTSVYNNVEPIAYYVKLPIKHRSTFGITIIYHLQLEVHPHSLRNECYSRSRQNPVVSNLLPHTTAISQYEAGFAM